MAVAAAGVCAFVKFVCYVGLHIRASKYRRSLHSLMGRFATSEHSGNTHRTCISGAAI